MRTEDKFQMIFQFQETQRYLTLQSIRSLLPHQLTLLPQSLEKMK